MERRKFIKIGGSLLTIPVLTGLYAWQVEPFWLDFVHLPMPMKGLPDSLEEKTVMQISDMHVGNRFPRKFLIDSLEKAAQFKPDIVVYTGDFVSYESPEQLEQLETVFKSVVKGKLGTLAILGNHDYGQGWNQPEVAESIINILSRQEIKVLRNETSDIQGLQVVGIDDYWGTNYNPSAIMKNIQTDRDQLFLCHNPDVADEPIWDGKSGWILSGHTHGGQVKPPFLSPPMLPVKNKNYTSGEFSLSPHLRLYINRALGHLKQVRFNVRPEITIFTLQHA